MAQVHLTIGDTQLNIIQPSKSRKTHQLTTEKEGR